MSRRSTHKAAIDRVLAKACGPLSATEVREALSDTGIGIATVYRILKLGVEDGRYDTVQMPHGATRYEPANRPHHHHFECLACHRVFDVMGCPGHLDDLVPDGFVLKSHELLLHGECPSCKEEDAA